MQKIRTSEPLLNTLKIAIGTGLLVFILFSFLLNPRITGIKTTGDKETCNSIIVLADRCSGLNNRNGPYIEPDSIEEMANKRKIEFYLLNASTPSPAPKMIKKYPYQTEDGASDDAASIERPFEKLNNVAAGDDNKHFFLINTLFMPGYGTEFYTENVAMVTYDPESQDVSVSKLVNWKLGEFHGSYPGAPFSLGSSEISVFTQNNCRPSSEGGLWPEGWPVRSILKNTDDVYEAIGAGLIDDSKVAILCGERNGNSDHLVICKLNNGDVQNIGVEPVSKLDLGMSVYYWRSYVDTFNPIAVSPSKNELAFFANLKADAPRECTVSENTMKFGWTGLGKLQDDLRQHELCLVTYDIEKNCIKKRIVVRENGCFLYRPQVVWCPDSKRNLIVVSYYIDGAWDANFPEARAMLVNVNDGRILKTWAWRNKLMLTEKESATYSKCFTIPIKSIRWTPEGTRIGFLTVDGQLFVHDLNKDSTTCVAEDKDYFDFYWVE